MVVCYKIYHGVEKIGTVLSTKRLNKLLKDFQELRYIKVDKDGNQVKDLF